MVHSPIHRERFVDTKGNPVVFGPPTLKEGDYLIDPIDDRDVEVVSIKDGEAVIKPLRGTDRATRPVAVSECLKWARLGVTYRKEENHTATLE